jgi:transcriptional regulator with XRE-family HTH domain
MTKAMSLTSEAADFGRVIQRLRLSEGWTITEFARRAGYSKNHLRLLEQGKNLPSVTILFHLAEVFRVEAAEIVREVEQARRERKTRRASRMLAEAGHTVSPEETATEPTEAPPAE